jgi:hypothetical protein
MASTFGGGFVDSRVKERSELYERIGARNDAPTKFSSSLLESAKRENDKGLIGLC